MPTYPNSNPPQNPPTPGGVPVPVFGSQIFNSNGTSAGVNVYNPNTGQLLPGALAAGPYNPNTGQRYNQNTSPNQNTSGTSSPSQNNSYQNQYNQSQTNQQNAFNQYQSQMQGLVNGTTPLNAGQQAQIAGLTQQFQGLIETQKNINANSLGSARAGAYRSGAVEGTDFITSTINPIVTAGVNKIKALEIAMASGIAELTTAMRNDQIKNVKMLWDDYKANEESKQKVFKDMIEESNKAIEAENERLIQEDKEYYERVTKPIQGVLKTLKEQGAPEDIIQNVGSSESYEEALQNSENWLQKQETQVVRSNGRNILVNKNTGKTVFDFGNANAPKGTTAKAPPLVNQVSAIQNFIKTGIAPSGEKIGNGIGDDGYVDPYVYKRAFKEWTGTTKSFLAQFPVVGLVNPASYSVLPEAIRPKTKASTSANWWE